MTDPRAMLETYASQSALTPEGADWPWDVESHALEAIEALRAVLDLVDNMESNADVQETNGTDPMIVHQKRHDLKCVRNAISTALGGDQ